MIADPPPRVRVNKRIRLLFAAIVIGGVFLIPLGIHQIQDELTWLHTSEALQSHGVTTVGKVVAVSFAPSDEAGGGSTSLRVRLSDESGKTVVSSIDFLGQTGDRVGSDIGIIYDSKNPELIDLVHDRQFEGTSHDGIAIGVAVLAAGVLIPPLFVLLMLLRVNPGPPGWYSDPQKQNERRMWDGHIWISHASEEQPTHGHLNAPEQM